MEKDGLQRKERVGRRRQGEQVVKMKGRLKNDNYCRKVE